MPVLPIARRGEAVGSLDLPEPAPVLTAILELGAGGSGLAIAAAVGDAQAMVIFPWTGESIEIGTSLRWSSEGWSEVMPLFTVQSTAISSRERRDTGLWLSLELAATAGATPFSVELDDHSEGGFLRCRWSHQYSQAQPLALEGVLCLQLGESGAQDSLEGEFSFASLGSGVHLRAGPGPRSANEAEAAAFSLECYGAIADAARMESAGSSDPGCALAWLLLQMVRPLARAEGEVPVRVSMGLAAYGPELVAAGIGVNGQRDLATAGAMLEEITAAEAFSVEAMPAAPPEAAAAEAEFRQLQARVFDDRGETEPSTVAECFRPDSAYLVQVRIGFADPEWLNSEMPFPEHELPPSPTGHRLTVVFVEPDHHPEPSFGYLDLPPEGTSTTCQFRFRTRGDVPQVSARLVILFQNRVLYTMLLEGEVVPVPTAESAITFHPEVLVNPLYSNLESQEQFHHAIVLNHTPSGAAQALHLAGDKAELVALPGDLATHIANIDRRFAECDWASADFAKLQAPGTEGLLRYLAAHGSLLYKAVVTDQFLGADLAGDKHKPLQVVAARPEARLPVEFFYDGPAPCDTAKLCGRSCAALKCGQCDQCPGKSKDVVCPLGFWGLTRVIEWHLYRPDVKKEMTNSDFAFFEQADSVRHELSPFSCALFGASEKASKVDADCTVKVTGALTAVSGRAPLVATNWTDWVQFVGQNAPSLLLLITHTAQDANRVLTLEVGQNSVDIGQIDWPYVRPRPDAALPIVFLLGCSTGAPQVSFEGAVARFRGAGAAIVVSTIASILGRHASQVADGFLQHMAAALAPGSPPRTFGEVVQSVRRDLLRRGVPMVLAVVSYGDAGWRLKGTDHV